MLIVLINKIFKLSLKFLVLNLSDVDRVDFDLNHSKDDIGKNSNSYKRSNSGMSIFPNVTNRFLVILIFFSNICRCGYFVSDIIILESIKSF